MTARLAAVGTTFVALLLACGGGEKPKEATPAPEAAPAKDEGTGPLARIQKHGHLVVGMDMGEGGAGTPPMFFPDAAGKPDGFDYAVAKWVATTVGVPEVRLVNGQYSKLPEMLRASKEIDVVISGYTPTDLPGIQWSQSYLDYGLALVVPKASTVQKAADLDGKDVGVFADEAARNVVKGLVAHPRSFSELEDGYWDALFEGRIAGFFYDYPYAAAEIRAYGVAHPDRADAFRFAQYNLSDLHYAVAVRQGEDELLAKVNEAIERFWESDQYGETIRKYLSGGHAVAAPKPAAGVKTVTVAKGDTLAGIAQKELGDKKRWNEIWKLNQSRIASPHLIEVGDVLILP